MRVKYSHKGEEFHRRITRLNPRRASIELDDGRIALIPYSMLENSDKALPERPKKNTIFDGPKKKTIKDEIQVGDWVTIKWTDGDSRKGKIRKKNPVKAKVLLEDGKIWNVPYTNILGKTSPGKSLFNIGDKVVYVDDYSGENNMYGVIVDIRDEMAGVENPRDTFFYDDVHFSRLIKIDEFLWET